MSKHRIKELEMAMNQLQFGCATPRRVGRAFTEMEDCTFVGSRTKFISLNVFFAVTADWADSESFFSRLRFSLVICIVLEGVVVYDYKLTVA